MLITEAYREQNRLLHAANQHYGTSATKWRSMVRTFSHWGRKPILDYGAGKATLQAALGPAYRITNYDPGVPGMEALPAPHAIVFCGDVLEHVEPACLGDVLHHLVSLTIERAILVINLGPASKSLPDGRNAHLIQQPVDWWNARLREHGFKIDDQGGRSQELWLVASPRDDAPRPLHPSSGGF